MYQGCLSKIRVGHLMTIRFKARVTIARLEASKKNICHLWIVALLIVAVATLPATKSFAQCPFGASGVDATDWQRTGAFPPNFLFGVATASHQVEGNNTNNDWWIFEQRGDVANSGEALNHRDLAVLARDLDLAQSLGINAYRFSIEWSRIEPQPGQFNTAEIEYYKKAIDEIRARGMKPIVGLNHYTLPRWLLDPTNHSSRPGWTANGVLNIIDRYTTYISKMAVELGSRVDYWTTFNEPSGQILAGYVAGVWSPGNPGSILGAPQWNVYGPATNNIIAAHRAAYRMLHATDVWDADGDGRPCWVGIVENFKPIFPSSSDLDNRKDARDWDYIGPKRMIDALTPVYYPPSPDPQVPQIPGYAFLDRVVGDPSLGINPTIGRKPGYNCWDKDINYRCSESSTESFLDFLGVNYYNPAVVYPGAPILVGPPAIGDEESGGISNSLIQTNTRPGRPSNDFSEEVFAGGPWEVFPEGLYCVLRDLWQRYRLPIMITENGLAEIGSKGLDPKITKRPAFIVSHLQMVLRAISEGIPVLGYIYWTLLDNFEWREAYDTRTKFGLWHVRFNNEAIAPLQFGQSLGPASFKEQDPSLRDSSGNYVRTETAGATAFREIVQARAITPQILARWGSFPRFLGDITVASEVRTIHGPVDVPPDLRLEGTEVIEPLFLSGCRIIDIDVMVTDGNGNPQPQDVNLHQGGRVAYTHLQPFNIRLEIIESYLGTNNGRVTVRWSRDSPTAAFSFRLFYRLVNCTGAASAIYVDRRNACFFPSGARECVLGFGGPFPKVADGVGAIAPGNVLFIRAGTYNEPMTINKRLEIRSYDGVVIIGR